MSVGIHTYSPKGYTATTGMTVELEMGKGATRMRCNGHTPSSHSPAPPCILKCQGGCIIIITYTLQRLKLLNGYT